MALLIISLDKVIGSAQAFRDAFREQLPDLPIRFWPDVGEVGDIEYLAFMHPDFDALPAFPNLKAMFSRSAGVESFVEHAKLPKVPLGKVEPAGGDPMMTEYVVMHVLSVHHLTAGKRTASLTFPPFLPMHSWRSLPSKITHSIPEEPFAGRPMPARRPNSLTVRAGFAYLDTEWGHSTDRVITRPSRAMRESRQLVGGSTLPRWQPARGIVR